MTSPVFSTPSPQSCTPPMTPFELLPSLQEKIVTTPFFEDKDKLWLYELVTKLDGGHLQEEVKSSIYDLLYTDQSALQTLIQLSSLTSIQSVENLVLSGDLFLIRYICNQTHIWNIVATNITFSTFLQNLVLTLQKHCEVPSLSEFNSASAFILLERISSIIEFISSKSSSLQEFGEIVPLFNVLPRESFHAICVSLQPFSEAEKETLSTYITASKVSLFLAPIIQTSGIVMQPLESSEISPKTEALLKKTRAIFRKIESEPAPQDSVKKGIKSGHLKYRTPTVSFVYETPLSQTPFAVFKSFQVNATTRSIKRSCREWIASLFASYFNLNNNIPSTMQIFEGEFKGMVQPFCQGKSLSSSTDLDAIPFTKFLDGLVTSVLIGEPDLEVDNLLISPEGDVVFIDLENAFLCTSDMMLDEDNAYPSYTCFLTTSNHMNAPIPDELRLQLIQKVFNWKTYSFFSFIDMVNSYNPPLLQLDESTALGKRLLKLESALVNPLIKTPQDLIRSMFPAYDFSYRAYSTISSIQSPLISPRQDMGEIFRNMVHYTYAQETSFHPLHIFLLEGLHKGFFQLDLVEKLIIHTADVWHLRIEDLFSLFYSLYEADEIDSMFVLNSLAAAVLIGIDPEDVSLNPGFIASLLRGIAMLTAETSFKEQEKMGKFLYRLSIISLKEKEDFFELLRCPSPSPSF